MTRPALLVLLLAGMAVSVAPLIPDESEERKREFAQDEVRMFAVEPGRPVTLTIPAGSRAVDLTVLALVEPQEHYDPAWQYRFGLNASLQRPGGKVEQQWDIHLASRVSVDSFPPTRKSLFGAKLQSPNQWVTDSRVVSLALGDLAAASNLLLKLEPGRGRYSRLLLVGFARRDPTLVPKGFLEQKMEALARKKIGSVKAALGFNELPQSAIEAALGSHRVRLDAVGRRKYDYELLSVTLSTYRRRTGRARSLAATPHSFATGPERWLALATRGSVVLNFRGRPKTILNIVDGIHRKDGLRLRVQVRDDGYFEGFALADSPARTIAIYADSPAEVAVYTDAAGARTQLGDPARVRTVNDRHWITPDIRRGKWLALDPHRPLEYEVEPIQSNLRVLLRAKAGGESGAVRQPVAAFYEMETPQKTVRGELSGRVKTSRFEYWQDGSPSTHALTRWLQIPAETRRFRLWGAPTVRARVTVPVPGLSEDILRPPYRIELGQELRWRYPPRVLGRAEQINPLDYRSLIDENRLQTLTLQTRIISQAWYDQESEEGSASRRRKWRPARQLVPLGSPLKQRILVRQRLGTDAAFPRFGWTEISPAREVVVPASHKRRPVEVVFRVSEDALGNAVRVLNEGIEVASQRAITTWQKVVLPLKPGRHRLAVEGVGAQGTAFVNVGPAEGGAIYRRRAAHELSAASSLTYRFSVEKGDRLTVLIQAFSEKDAQRWAATYRVFANRHQESDTKLRSELVARGVIGNRIKDARNVWFRDLGMHRGAGWSESRIELKKIEKPGLRTVKLHSVSRPERIWVRAVLIGKTATPAEETIKIRRRRRFSPW